MPCRQQSGAGGGGRAETFWGQNGLLSSPSRYGCLGGRQGPVPQGKPEHRALAPEAQLFAGNPDCRGRKIGIGAGAGARASPSLLARRGPALRPQNRWPPGSPPLCAPLPEGEGDENPPQLRGQRKGQPLGGRRRAEAERSPGVLGCGAPPRSVFPARQARSSPGVWRAAP